MLTKLQWSISYVQSQVGKVSQYSFRIQTSLLFRVTCSGGTTPYLASFDNYPITQKNARFDLHIFPGHLWGKDFSFPRSEEDGLRVGKAGSQKVKTVDMFLI
jgi:hypothetical protein